MDLFGTFAPQRTLSNDLWCSIGFSHAFRHLLLGTSYADAIAETLLGGGDTDTNACIVGGLVGALHGAAAIPAQMSGPVLHSDTKKGKPRPEMFQPHDLQRTSASPLSQLRWSHTLRHWAEVAANLVAAGAELAPGKVLTSQELAPVVIN